MEVCFLKTLPYRPFNKYCTKTKYKDFVSLQALNDDFEIKAHNSMLKKQFKFKAGHIILYPALDKMLFIFTKFLP